MKKTDTVVVNAFYLRNLKNFAHQILSLTESDDYSFNDDSAVQDIANLCNDVLGLRPIRVRKTTKATKTKSRK